LRRYLCHLASCDEEGFNSTAFREFTVLLL